MRRDTARLQCRPEIANSSNLPFCNVFDLSSTVRCDHARFGSRTHQRNRWRIDWCSDLIDQKTLRLEYTDDLPHDRFGQLLHGNIVEFANLMVALSELRTLDCCKDRRFSSGA